MSAALAPTTRPVHILLAEDDESDVLLTRLGFEQAEVPALLHHVWNGAECLAFLRKEAEFAEAPMPDLLLLDLDMPRMDGREVLQAIVADPALRHLPVVVLTTSSAEQDVREMYRLRCSSYVAKPIDFAEFVRVARDIGQYWFATVMLPEV